MTFTSTPVTRLLVIGLVSASIGASMLDIKHYFYITIDTHLWRYRQLWRFFAYQLCYTNSIEVLFAAMSLYNLRVVERMWGSRKFAVSNEGTEGSERRRRGELTGHVVLPRRLLDLHIAGASRHHDGAAPSFGRALQLHARRSDANHIQYSGPVPRHGASRLQISRGDVAEHAGQRLIGRSHLVGQIVPVRHRAAPVAAAVARVSGGRLCRLDRGQRVAEWCDACIPGVLAIAWMDGRSQLSETKRRV